MANSESEEKINISRRFILSAPPGEVNEVIADVKALLCSNPSIEEHLPAIMREYNQTNLVVIKAASGDKVLTSEDGESKRDVYVDHSVGKAFEVDHVRSEIIAASEAEGVDSAVDAYRLSAQDAISKYAKVALSDGYGAVHGRQTSDGQMMITISLSGVKLNARNYWNGRWTSSWKTTFSPHDSNSTLVGSTRVLVHYYEDGNVQLEMKRQHSLLLQWSDSATFGAAVAEAVKSGESNCANWIDRTYASLSETAFKALRRKIPRTQTKFQWDKVAAYSLGKELANK